MNQKKLAKIQQVNNWLHDLYNSIEPEKILLRQAVSQAFITINQQSGQRMIYKTIPDAIDDLNLAIIKIGNRHKEYLSADARKILNELIENTRQSFRKGWFGGGLMFIPVWFGGGH